MYLAADQAGSINVWHCEKLNMDFWTLDGFCYYLWYAPESMVPALQQKKCLQWLKERVGDAFGFPEDENLSTLVLWLLKQCPVTTEKPVEQVVAVAEHYVQMTADDRYKEMGDDAYNEKRYAQAIGFYKKALSIRQRADVLNNMGLIYMMAGEMERAEFYFGKSIRLDTGATARMNLVRLQLVTKAYDKALGNLNHVASLHDRSDIWYYYGCTYGGLGQEEESVMAYVRALDEAPDEKSVKAFVDMALKMDRRTLVDHCLISRELPSFLKLYMMARVDFYLDDMEGYADHLERAVEISGNPNLTLELAVHCASAGQIIKGLTLLENVSHDNKNEEWLAYTRSLVAQAAGNDTEYTKWVNQLRDGWKANARQMVQR